MDFFWSLPKASMISDEHLVGELFGTGQARRHEANKVLSDPSTVLERAFLCTRGMIKVTKLLSNGREILITVLEPGAIWSDRALLKGYWREVFVETMSAVETTSITRESFEQYVRSDAERLTEIIKRISEQISDALTLLDDFRGRDVASRLASVLVRFSKEHGVQNDRSVIIDIPFTHQDLANMIGSARETVSRSMARFRAEGYLRSSQNSTLEIVNLQKLEALIV